ncbi:MAG: hypothetical protein HY290_14545 [Planctomycetia bacterium]|nr:hypothetical protein [Planctomycetia bacterium]
MPRYGTILTTALLAIAASAPLRADDAAWQAISEEAAMVVRLQNPAKAMRDLTAFAALVSEGGGDQVEQWLTSVTEKLSLPNLPGVDLDSSWWVAVYGTDIETEPAYVVLLPATDKKLLRESLDAKIRSIDCGKYLAITIDNSAADKTAARLAGAGKSLREFMDTESRVLFDGGELSAFGHTSPLAKAGNGRQGADRKAGKVNLGTNLAATSDGQSAVDVTPEWLSRAAGDLQCGTMTCGVSETGITMEYLVRFRTGSDSAKLIPNGASNQFDDVSALPPGGILYFGATGAWLERWRALLKPAEGVGNDPDRIVPPNPALSAVKDELRALPLGSMAFSTRMSRDFEKLGGAMISRPKDVPRFKKLSRQIALLQDGTRTETFQWKVDRKLAAERYGDELADVTDWRREFRKRRDAGWQAENWTSREVYRDGSVVTTEGGERADMQALLAALDTAGNAPPPDSARTATRSQLHPKSDLILLVDAPRSFARLGDLLALALSEALSQNLFLGWLMADAKPVEKPNPLDQMQLPASYSGLSMNAVPDGVRIRAFVPLAQVQAFARLSEFNARQVDAGKKAQVDEEGDGDGDGWIDSEAADPKDVDEDAVFSRLDVEDFDSTVFGGAGHEAEDKSRKLKEMMQALMLDSVDWACDLSERQKQKIRLAGKGDLARLFNRVHEERRRFEELANSGQDRGLRKQLYQDADAARNMLESNPFAEDTMFIKSIRTSLTAEQLPRYEALRAITRVGGKVSAGARGQELLQAIDLHSTKFSNQGLGLVGKLTFVQALNLDSTRITDDGLVHLRGLARLQELNLAGTDVSDAGLVHVAGLKNLRSISLSCTRASDAAAAHLAGLTDLRTLNLFGTQISDAGLARLRGLKNLESLRLGGTRISDEGLLKLDIANLARLEDVGLDGTEVSDAGIIELARLPRLRELDLRNSRVSDAGIAHLRRAKSLRSLYLDGAEVSKSAMDDLQSALPELTIYGR